MRTIANYIVVSATLAVALILTGCVRESSEPGRSERGADLAEGDLEEGDHSQVVSLTPEKIQSFKIRVEALKVGDGSVVLTRPARVMFDLDRLAKVGPRLRAKVVRVLKDLGESVRPGEPVAVMSSIDLGRAKATYLTALARHETDSAAYHREKGLYERKISSEAEMLEARARFEQAKADLEAAREALRLYGLSQQEIDQVRAGGEEPLSYSRLYSPIEGVIQQRDVSPGDSVSAEQTPIHVVDTRQVWVMIDAFEEDVPWVASEQRVEIRLHSLPERTFEGVTDWVSRALDKTTRTIRVRAVVDNPDRLLRAGMFGTARLHTGRTDSSLWVPVDAVQTVEGRAVLFVAGEQQGTFRPVPVELGVESDGLAQIVSGARPGMKVVISGAFTLKAALTTKPGGADHAD